MGKLNENASKYFSEELIKATGKIEFTLTNDYMFHVVLQNVEILTGLISAVMHIPIGEINDIRVENPIELGTTITDKTFVLDIKLTLNNQDVIDLEMQVLNEGNWRNRSLSYLCRNFDSLQKGEDYNSVSTVTHIGILDFDLFPEALEFYSTYKLLNVKSGMIFNDKFTLNVLSLNQIEIATDEDKKWKIDEWARLFKAKTWEELRMIAQQDEKMAKAATRLNWYNAERRAQDEADAKRYAENTMKRFKNERDEAVRKLDNANKKLDSANKELDSTNKKLDSANKELERMRELLVANGVEY